MAGVKIGELTPLGRNLIATDELELSLVGSTGSRKITGQEILSAARSGKQDDITLTTTGASGASTFIANTLNVPTYSLSGLGGVPTTRTLTINGTTQDLSADRTFTISTGITIGTTAITSGTVGRVLFEGTGNVVQESANLFWDNTNGRLGIGTSSPANPLEISYNSTLAQGIHLNSNTTATSFNGIKFSALNTNPSIFGLNNQTGEFRWQVGSGGYFPTIYSNGAERMRIFTTGNIGINTTTDAGFKLDVNGTARVDQTLRVNGTGTSIAIQFVSGRIDADGTWLRIKSPTNNQDMVNLTANFLGINATAVIPSAMMAITSTDRGFLPPRMTQAQRNAIASPAIGLEIYQTDATEGKYIYKSSGWTYIG